MFKHKVNQTIDIFQGALQRLIELDGANLGEGFILDESNAEEYGLLSNCQQVDKHSSAATSVRSCQLPIGELNIDLFGCEYGGICGLMMVGFNDVNSCIAFSSAPWHEVVPQEFYTGGAGYGFLAISESVHYYRGRSEDTWTLADVTQACHNACSDLNSCYLLLYIREY